MNPNRSSFRASLLVAALLLFAGCATVTFKRGAQPDAMASDEQACRRAHSDEVGYVECMRTRGWFVSGGSPAASDRPTTDAPAKAPSPAAVAPAAAKPPRPVPSAGVVLPAAAPTPPAAELAPESPPPAVVPAPIDDTEAVQPAATAVPSEADPLARVEVRSWWKFGGTPADLDVAMAACVTKLGSAHQPNPGATVVTVGLRQCLRDAGWRSTQ